MFRINYIEPIIMIATLCRWFILAVITGSVVGCGTTLFLKGLYSILGQTASIPLWVQMVILPLGGLLNGLMLFYAYRHVKSGNKDSVVAAVHEQEGKLPIKTMPIKPIAAIITLASGGSAGKEGPCSHIGGSLASWIGRILKLEPNLQKRMVACGVSAGFASVFGTPIAGAIYGIEILTIGRLRYDIIFPAIISSIVSFEISKWWGMTYRYFPIQVPPHFSETLFLKVIVIGILCGLLAWLFIEVFEKTTTIFHLLQERFGIWPPFMPFIGGIIIALLIFGIPTLTSYLGLSLPIMEEALDGKSIPYSSIFWKILLVSITLGSGFYGGIVTPQFVIGALSGSMFANLLGVDPAFGAAIGMVAVVASASNTPLSAVFMGYELFSGNIGIYVVGACITAYIVIGHRSVYPDQLVAFSKSLWMHITPGIPLQNEKIHVSYGLLRKMEHVKRKWKS